MSYIVRESTGCCLQDPGYEIYRSKNPRKRIIKLFLDLLLEADFDEEYIKNAKEEIKEEGYFEDERCVCYERSAWVDFIDVYSTRTYLTIVD